MQRSLHRIESGASDLYGDLLCDSAWAASHEDLHTFKPNGTDGYYPHGSLIFDGAGNLYGTTFGGGA